MAHSSRHWTCALGFTGAEKSRRALSPTLDRMHPRGLHLLELSQRTFSHTLPLKRPQERVRNAIVVLDCVGTNNAVKLACQAGTPTARRPDVLKALGTISMA